MRFLVFQHLDCEHPGVFRDFMRAAGIGWDVVALDKGGTIPDPGPYHALMVMGGPMDVWEETAYPWLVAEKRAIAAWVRAGRPCLGVCLGHQLLAAALGGTVAPMARAEVGIHDDVTLTEAGRTDPLFQGLGPGLTCFQWHGAGVTALPAEANSLAASPACPIQAMRVGARAYGLQYHVEITGETVNAWSAVPAYADALEGVLGPGGRTRLESAVAERLGDFNRDARLLFDNFLRIAAQ